MRITVLLSLAALTLAQGNAQGGSHTSGHGNATATSQSGHGAAPAGQGGAPGSGGKTQGPDPDIENWFLAKCMLWVWLTLIGTVTVYTWYRHAAKYIRTVACLNNDTQRYFQQPNHLYSKVRKHLLDAPLITKRHHREFRLSTAINMGTLPNRVQFLFMLAYLAMFITLATYDMDFSVPMVERLAQLIGRLGTLTVMNMLPLFLMAGRNNPLIKLTGISFDSYNFVHRWLGRMTVLTAVAHGLSWVFHRELLSGWAAVHMAELTSKTIITGTMAVSAFVALLLQSPSPIRHAFYETFLTGHILIVVFALVVIWIHTKEFGNIHTVLYGVVALWAFERSARLTRLIYRNVGAGGTKAHVEVLPGDAVRVTMDVARPWTFQPGQHAYIYMPTCGLWTSHPFTVAWSENTVRVQDVESSSEGDAEKGGSIITETQQNVLGTGKTKLSFIVRRRTGFTDSLYQKASKSVSGKFSTSAFVEGPYGGESLRSFGTVLLFAAGVGITHQTGHIRDLVVGFHNGTVATRKVVLVWAIQNPEHLDWIQPWMTQILSLPRRREILRIMIFVTRPRSTREVQSPSASVQMFPGKPNVQALIAQEVEESVGAVGVNVCGVGGFADDVRRACRSWMGKVDIELVEESFSW